MIHRIRGVQERYNPGKIWQTSDTVFATAYGPNKFVRTIVTYHIMKVPNWGWNDQTGDLRESVRKLDDATVVYGGGDTYYAVYVEAYLAPLRTAFKIALKQVGFFADDRSVAPKGRAYYAEVARRCVMAARTTARQAPASSPADRRAEQERRIKEQHQRLRARERELEQKKSSR